MKRGSDGEPKAAAISPRSAQQQKEAARVRCPFLDTIKRQYLDFDKPKLCSVCLSTDNVYACLVCGMFFQGRGKKTPCFTHSVEFGHHVFMKMTGKGKGQIHCLPDNYEVFDTSLDDIKTALEPKFSNNNINHLDTNKALATDVTGTSYLPGYVGMNNLNHTDYINAVVTALAHVAPFRDFFLDTKNYAHTESKLVNRFGDLICKLWSKGNYRNAVSPHDFVQEVTVASKRQFTIGKRSEAVEFLQWLLNTLSKDVFGIKKRNNPILKPFSGLVEVATEKNQEGSEEMVWETRDVPFLYLGIDLPPVPLFKDAQGGNVIPQIPLFNVLDKLDGNTVTDKLRAGVRERKKYRVKRMPQFLVFHLNRFTRNNWFMEKNPTIVTFPVRNLDVKDYMFQDELPTAEKAGEMKVGELKGLLKLHKMSTKGCLEKSDLMEKYAKLLKKKDGDTQVGG
jgi:U4/U6.U5 tri-snRNP-associated protein 2